jgi:hypothetical protein
MFVFKGSEMHELDVFTLVPLLATGWQGWGWGRRATIIIGDVLEEYLHPDKEHYVDLNNGKYILYLTMGKYDLGTFKMEIICMEIRRRFYEIIKEGYFQGGSRPHIL